MEFDFFGHGKSWKVMEFEVPKRVWTLKSKRMSLMGQRSVAISVSQLDLSAGLHLTGLTCIVPILLSSIWINYYSVL